MIVAAVSPLILAYGLVSQTTLALWVGAITTLLGAGTAATYSTATSVAARIAVPVNGDVGVATLAVPSQVADV